MLTFGTLYRAAGYCPLFGQNVSFSCELLNKIQFISLFPSAAGVVPSKVMRVLLREQSRNRTFVVAVESLPSLKKQPAPGSRPQAQCLQSRNLENSQCLLAAGELLSDLLLRKAR